MVASRRSDDTKPNESSNKRHYIELLSMVGTKPALNWAGLQPAGGARREYDADARSFVLSLAPKRDSGKKPVVSYPPKASRAVPAQEASAQSMGIPCHQPCPSCSYKFSVTCSTAFREKTVNGQRNRAASANLTSVQVPLTGVATLRTWANVLIDLNAICKRHFNDRESYGALEGICLSGPCSSYAYASVALHRIHHAVELLFEIGRYGKIVMCSSSLPSDEVKDDFIAGLPPNLAFHPVTPTTTLLIGLSHEEKISRQRDGPNPARRSETRRADARGAEPRSNVVLHVEGGLAARVNRRSGRAAVREKTERSAVRNGVARQQAAAAGVVRHGVNDGESSCTELESPQVQHSERNAETQASEGPNHGLKVTTATVEAPRPWLTSTGTSTTGSPQKKMCDAGTSLFTEELGDAMGLLEHAVTDTFCPACRE
ncbi:hypothetical protein FOZ60_016224 [Perkinsus olseni]|uniref:Uncharacterized protein n=1 Tax=Perkinsus olseni TaxID=32597 RepID=A0A7J6P4U7_PEROL|nr:hypothetical protein FOZ60_016224 [Perkinsus olseni]